MQSSKRVAEARCSWSRFVKIAAVGLLLWSGPYFALGLARGWSSLHVRQYRFFTQAAFVTFGGAYAVLAYVTQAAVQSFHWITQAQAIDGLGLAETTPGPLIMVLQFIGFMSGWNRPEGMSPLASATLGALVTTYVTFLPCFFYIFLGAPYIEGLRGNRSLTSALSGITAAIVGVILNLAMVFGARGSATKVHCVPALQCCWIKRRHGYPSRPEPLQSGFKPLKIRRVGE